MNPNNCFYRLNEIQKKLLEKENNDFSSFVKHTASSFYVSFFCAFFFLVDVSHKIIIYIVLTNVVFYMSRYFKWIIEDKSNQRKRSDLTKIYVEIFSKNDYNEEETKKFEDSINEIEQSI